MSTTGKQRLVDGPEQEFLTLSEVAKYLSIEKKTLQRLIARGDFPRPLKMSPGTPCWGWRDVTAYVMWVELASRRRVRTQPKGTPDALPRTPDALPRTKGKRPHVDA